MSSQYTILVVDDESSIRVLLDKYLSATYKVILAKDGAQAWKKIEELEGKIDIVLSDIQMPILDGVSLLKRIKATYQDICVIMMSGASDIHTAIQAIRAGAYDYISKPISELEEIHILVQRWSKLQSIETKLSQYASLHKDIMQNLKVRTFLGVDVVGSKLVKSGADPLLIHHTFLAYHRFIESIIVNNAGQIHSTAGDGAMACFILPQAAINSARQILEGLDAFNKNQNQLSGKFSLRIGIHTGTVIVEESGRVSEMYSQALDITGHIQKNADINQVAVSEGTVESLPDKRSFSSLHREMDGFPVYSLNI